MGAPVLLFVVAFAVGLVGSIPAAGPVGMLVAARGLEGRSRAALAVATGAGVAEALYAGAAYGGIAAVLVWYPGVAAIVHWATALVLIPLGVSLILARPAAARPPVRAGSDFVVGLAIAALNPTFVATWTAAGAAVQAAGLASGRASDAVLFAIGAGTGGVAWSWILLELIARHRDRLRPAVVTRLIQAAGVLLLLLGAYSILRVVLR